MGGGWLGKVLIFVCCECGVKGCWVEGYGGGSKVLKMLMGFACFV
jgi:hypothetical protein